MQVIKSFEFNETNLSVYGTTEKPMFKAKEVGEILGLSNIRENLKTIDDKHKVVSFSYTPGGKQQMTFITEPAIYKLVFRSNKIEAQNFADWVFEEVLPSIRKTGQYKAPEIKKYIDQNKEFDIHNETQLHKKVISFIHTQEKQRKLNLDIDVPCGETQDTSFKRIDAWKKGFEGGHCDININHKSKFYNGLCLELKSPKATGELSDKQHKYIEKKRKNKYNVLVSNDYDEIIVTILKYLDNLRLECEYCIKRFKTEESRNKHIIFFHKHILTS